MIEEQPEVRALHRFIQIGIREYDVRALAAQLQRDALQIGLGGGLHDQMADFGGAGEGHLVHVHVVGDGRAGGGTESGQHVHDAFRESRFHDQLADAQRGQRRLLRRLHHHGVAGGQRRGQLPGLHQHGEIPGNDLPHHADRLDAACSRNKSPSIGIVLP